MLMGTNKAEGGESKHQMERQHENACQWSLESISMDQAIAMELDILGTNLVWLWGVQQALLPNSSHPKLSPHTAPSLAEF